MFSLGHLGQNMYRQEYFHILNIMHISEMSDVVMVKRVMMMLVMGAGFQFSSLTSGVVGQSVTAGDQQQSHYSSIVTQAQSTTQNNAHRHYTKQHTTNTRTVYSMEHTQSSTSTAHKRKGETSTVCIIYCHKAHRHTQNNTHQTQEQHIAHRSTKYSA